ncbi:MAG: hypothetical protein J6Y24_09955 [Bacteroidales bacterium]|nr:hypothetical protein [Bacteroidales bacterium]
MKKVKLSLLTMCAAALTATALSGCYKGELYDIDEPENLQDRIKQAAINNANKKQTGDFVSVEEPYQVGITGTFKNAYWSTFSKYYKLGKGDTLTLKFRNYSDCKANYDNWCCFVTSDADLNAPEGYEEYAGQRADRWDNIRQQNASFSGTMTSLSNDEEWAAWLKTMNKADVEISVIRNHAGMVKILSTTITSDGKEWTCDQDGIITTGDYVRVIMVCERSYLQFYYSNKVGEEDPKSTIGEVDTGEDHFPVSIAIDNYPTALELGDEDYWKNGEATITFDNGATITAKTKDITFTVPDLTTVGKKTIILSYSKSKKGGYGQAVATSYQIEVTNKIRSISAKYIGSNKTFYYFDNPVELIPSLFELAAEYSDKSTGTIDVKNATFTLNTEGKVIAKYNDYECEVDGIITAKGKSAAGTPDKSSSWQATQFGEVEGGQTKTVKVFVYGRGVNDWECALPEIVGANGGWTLCFNGNNWGFNEPTMTGEIIKNDFFIENVFSHEDRKNETTKGLDFTITFTNNGDGTAVISETATTSDGVERTITLKMSNVPTTFNTDVTIDGAYVVFHD